MGSYTLRLGVSTLKPGGLSLSGELPLDLFFFLLPIGVEEGELLEDELEKGLTTRCGEQFRPTPFPLGLFTDSLDCFFVVFLLGGIPFLQVL